MTTPITLENFTRALYDAVVERGPEYVYPRTEPGFGTSNTVYATCLYRNSITQEAACLIGQGLFGIDPELLPSSECTIGARELLIERLDADVLVGQAARIAQMEQDNGETWGKAWSEYLSALDRRGIDVDGLLERVGAAREVVAS